MNEKPMCPMKFSTNLYKDDYCFEEKCAWWDSTTSERYDKVEKEFYIEDKRQCAIMAISLSLSRIEGSIRIGRSIR